MSKNPYEIVKQFEEEVAKYTGAPYAVAVDSCTNAIFLACMYENIVNRTVVIPLETYLSVPQSILRAGGKLVFRDYKWKGVYLLENTNIIDAAKRFTSHMYVEEHHVCLSFHIKKHLKLGKGGMILTQHREAAEWFKKARYEGRTEGVSYHEDDIDMMGWNMYMTPQQAAHGLALMQDIKKENSDLPEKPYYKKLNEFSFFKHYEVVS